MGSPTQNVSISTRPVWAYLRPRPSRKWAQLFQEWAHIFQPTHMTFLMSYLTCLNNTYEQSLSYNISVCSNFDTMQFRYELFLQEHTFLNTIFFFSKSSIKLYQMGVSFLLGFIILQFISFLLFLRIILQLVYIYNRII